MSRTGRNLLPAAVLLGVCGSLPAATVSVHFVEGSRLARVDRAVPEGQTPIEAAVEALASGPTADEQAAGIDSAIPPGTTIHGLVVDGPTVTIDFSPEVLSRGLGELTVETIYRQATWTLRQFGQTSDLRLTIGGELLSSYLPPVKHPTPAPPPVAAGSGPLGSLSGHSVTLSPGHGYCWYYDPDTGNSWWGTQRPAYCSPLNQEDFHNLEMCQYLETYLLADGMTVRLVRCTNKSYGTYSGNGHPWWQQAAYVWLKNIGYPCSVYASSSGDCNLGSGTVSESNDDIRSRPLASDRDGSDIYLSVHTNGASGYCVGSGCPTGSETYYDDSPDHAAWGTASQNLATTINNGIMTTITGNVDSSWTCHGVCVKDSNGNYGEIRIPNRPATLTELAFHDTCDRDADEYHLRENFFRSAAMWGMYKGVCGYFGTTPTWGFYSDEYVSDTIPTTMTGRETYSVSVTFRNRGVLWASDRGFRLGAVGDSDPFTAYTRVDPAVQVGPGQQYTFSFTMTAPATPGQYTTDWRMLREGVTWFGATLTRQIQVLPGPVRVDFDGDTDVDMSDFAHMQLCLSGATVEQDLAECQNARLDADSDVDQDDMNILLRCLSGATVPAAYDCEGT